MTSIFIGSAVVLALAVLIHMQLAHVRRVKRQRGALFDQTKHLFNNVKLIQDGINYPTLKGLYRGRPIKLEPIVDATAFRKLPVLWLLVTYYRPLPVTSPLDILLRPMGSEFFSPNSNFEHDIMPAVGWPEHIRISSPTPSKAPPLSVLQPFVSFMDDPLTKELLITAKGIRVVHQIAEGSQTHYRVTRRAELDTAAFTPARLIPLLTVLLEMSDALAGQQDI